MGAMAEVKKPNNTIDKLALIVTTYKRQQLLETLFDSILALEQAPWRIVIVDNEQSDQTADMVAAFAGKVTGQWGTTVADQSGNEERVVYAPQTENLGGAGGFSAGVAKAYELGAAWFWVMDDDVAVLPDAIAKLVQVDRRARRDSGLPDSTTMAARSTGSTTSSCRWASRTRSRPPHSARPDTE